MQLGEIRPQGIIQIANLPGARIRVWRARRLSSSLAKNLFGRAGYRGRFHPKAPAIAQSWLDLPFLGHAGDHRAPVRSGEAPQTNLPVAVADHQVIQGPPLRCERARPIRGSRDGSCSPRPTPSVVKSNTLAGRRSRTRRRDSRSGPASPTRKNSPEKGVCVGTLTSIPAPSDAGSRNNSCIDSCLRHAGPGLPPASAKSSNPLRASARPVKAMGSCHDLSYRCGNSERSRTQKTAAGRGADHQLPVHAVAVYSFQASGPGFRPGQNLEKRRSGSGCALSES